MAKKELGLEQKEAQAELEQMETESRDLRKLNDSLRLDNRSFEKSNKDLAIKNKHFTSEIDSKKSVLKKLRDNEAERLNAIKVDEDKIAKDRKEIKEGQTINYNGLKDIAIEVDRLNKIKDSVAASQLRLAERTKTLKEDKEGLANTIKEYKNKLSALSLEEHKAINLTANKEAELVEVEKLKDELGVSREKVKEAEELYLVKKAETEREKQVTIKLNKELKDTQKGIYELEKGIEGLKKIAGDRLNRISSKEKSIDSTIAALEIREKEVQIKELRVKKLIKENKLDKDIAKLKKETGE